MKNTNGKRVPWLANDRKDTGYLFDDAMVTCYGETGKAAPGHNIGHHHDYCECSTFDRRKQVG